LFAGAGLRKLGGLFSLLLPRQPQNGAVQTVVDRDLGGDDDSTRHRIRSVSDLKRAVVVSSQHCGRQYFKRPSCQPSVGRGQRASGGVFRAAKNPSSSAASGDGTSQN